MKSLDKVKELQKIPCPVRFDLSGMDCTVEIQYFVPLDRAPKNENDTGLVHFAVTTDGWDLLIDPSSSLNVVLQREIDDIDSIDVTITDLLMAKHAAL